MALGTVHQNAANGHTMEYNVIGYDDDGTPRVSQWDALHSDRCRCLVTDDDTIDES
ncbi:hypothetical protein ABZS76_32855 [Streptomyces sp. NPDC005562]|uniref:hypothetical protein n=1 Tax=Streptomyces sp. NPDC005562 TaxID=3154890 RepID=UPI0033AE4317